MGANPVVREVELQRVLSTPVCELDIEPTGVLQECIEQVQNEVRRAGLNFQPDFYLGDDDFWTADRAISVNVPWYLSSGLLWGLVNDHLFRYTKAEVLMYLRHETGHALNYAFELWRRADWTATFGDFRRPYRDAYNPNPWSRDFVRYLHRTGMYHYAQKHPDEDWAETFAVWLDPKSRWRARYRDWQVAFAKLEYVDRLVTVERAAKGTAPNQRRGVRIPYTDIKETVAEYFKIPDAVDANLQEYRHDLLEIFSKPRGGRARASGAQSAARFIQQNQRLLIDRLGGWIQASDRRTIKRFLRRLEALCTSEGLVVTETRRAEKLVDLTILATWHVLDGIHSLSD